MSQRGAGQPDRSLTNHRAADGCEEEDAVGQRSPDAADGREGLPPTDDVSGTCPCERSAGYVSLPRRRTLSRHHSPTVIRTVVIVVTEPAYGDSGNPAPGDVLGHPGGAAPSDQIAVSSRRGMFEEVPARGQLPVAWCYIGGACPDRGHRRGTGSSVSDHAQVTITPP